MWEVIFFFPWVLFHLHHSFLPEELSKPKNTHNTDNSWNVFIFFVMVIVVSSHVRATESASHLVETVMKYFIHPPPPHPCQPIKMFYRNHDLSEVFCKFDCHYFFCMSKMQQCLYRKVLHYVNLLRSVHAFRWFCLIQPHTGVKSYSFR